MTVEYIRYTIPAGQTDAFVRDYRAAEEPLRRSPYALAFEIAQCSEDSTCFIVRIEWTSRDDHLKKFRASAEFREFFQNIKPYVSMINEMRHYDLR